jgi:hypothetical protein
MTYEEYAKAPGLTNSMMSDLAISPMRMWHHWIRPDRIPEEPTPQQVFGTALHCAVLEPDQFEKRYARELEPPEGCLRTMDDLRGFLKMNVVTPKGTRKAEIILQVQQLFPNALILDVLEATRAEQHAGKEMLSAEDWSRVNRCADALRREPELQKILRDPAGVAEVPISVTEPETDVRLKGKLDWVTPTHTLDLKTFVTKRGRSVDRSVHDAIFYEGYYRQAYFYDLLRGWSKTAPAGCLDRPAFIMAFVESEEPHEVRIKTLRPKTGGNVNLYWERARIEVRDLIQTYDQCMEQFGTEPWRTQQDVTPLYDEDLPGLGF